jgi:hypothetical protein
MMLASAAWIFQGVFYVATGIWSLVSPGSFQRVTGPKVDYWLVKTVGLLVMVIGGVLLSAGVRGRRSPELDALSAGSAASLAVIDVVYVRRGRISPVYLLDAAAEAGLLGMWGLGRWLEQKD